MPLQNLPQYFNEEEVRSVFMFFSLVTLFVNHNGRRRIANRTVAPRPPIRRRRRRCFWEFTSLMSETDFNRVFRMSRNSFKLLCDLLRPQIFPRFPSPQDAEEERRSHIAGRFIQTEMKLAIFLRIMAGGSSLDIYMLYNVCRASAFRFFKEVTKSVLRTLSWKCLPTPDAVQGFRSMTLRFTLSRAYPNLLPGCIAAVDGLTVQIERPTSAYQPLHYFSRKGYFSLPVQAVVDSEYRFIACSVFAVGSIHDNRALQLSDFYTHIRSGKIPQGFWIAGDEAYSCSEVLLVPFARSVCSPVHDAFNFFHSSHRIHVEQAFGMLKRRWGILQKPLAYDISFATKIIPAAMKLHNFCINVDRSGVSTPTRTSLERRIAEDRLDMWLDWCQLGVDIDDDLVYEVEDMSAAARRAERRSAIRGRLVVIVRRQNLRRPLIAARDEVSQN